MRKTLSRLALLTFLAMVISACSSSGSNSKDELGPAKLEKFTEEIKLKVQWSRSVGDGQGKIWNRLKPAVDGSSIFAADSDGRVFAFNRESGEPLWKKKLATPVSGALGAGNGLLLLGTLRGEVLALDSASGEEKWRAQVGSEVLAPPAINQDAVIVQTQDDRIFALNPIDGSQLWRFDNTPATLTLRGTSAPLVTSRLAVVGLSSGKVLALETRSGVPLWEQRIAIPQGRSELERIVDIDGSLLLSGNTLYVTSFQGQVVGLDLDNGEVLWQHQASSYTGVAEQMGHVFLSLANGTVESLDERTVSLMWSNNALARRELSAPAVFGDYIAVGDKEGYLHLLSQTDGHFVARQKIDGNGLRARPLVVDDFLYVYGNGGKLVALRIE
ncbi:outer membrane protein assembly factor BamB [Ventosimonas gracilis]|uniref:Outer membrane protein assembly factor BamB n=1 Tax=Ventosimonas gracilis TaxID=1680762 RepID=A0A139SXI8_9GAMM|nr:outer membrane protein assembly factor BamB [Ventosimonas gracilis]KXU39316.1 outer membrane protein assembly factor BamB [Ventosimonas gracilis]